MLAGSKAGVCCIAAAAVLALGGILSAPSASAAAPAPVTVAAAEGPCGAVEIGSSTSKDVLTAENCFSKAYSTCDSATFSVGYHGSDAGVVRSFQTMRNANTDQCDVAEVVDHYKGSTIASSDTYLCNSVKQGSDGLTFTNCGADGDVFVPANLTASNAKRLLTVAFARPAM